jgi:RNA polymerase sigma-70 factor (ECF subfamily)
MQQRQEFLSAFLTHQAGIRAFVRPLVPDAHAADDIFQEIALVLWENFDRYEQDRPFLPWARGIAWNKVLKARAQANRLPSPFSPEILEHLVTLMDAQDDRASDAQSALEQCLKQLPDSSRSMLTQRYAHELSLERIAEKLGKSPAAIHMTLSRLRKRLRECIETRLKSGMPVPEGPGA